MATANGDPIKMKRGVHFTFGIPGMAHFRRLRRQPVPIQLTVWHQPLRPHSPAPIAVSSTFTPISTSPEMEEATVC